MMTQFHETFTESQSELGLIYEMRLKRKPEEKVWTTGSVEFSLFKGRCNETEELRVYHSLKA